MRLCYLMGTLQNTNLLLSLNLRAAVTLCWVQQQTQQTQGGIRRREMGTFSSIKTSSLGHSTVSVCWKRMPLWSLNPPL